MRLYRVEYGGERVVTRCAAVELTCQLVDDRGWRVVHCVWQLRRVERRTARHDHTERAPHGGSSIRHSISPYTRITRAVNAP